MQYQNFNNSTPCMILPKHLSGSSGDNVWHYLSLSNYGFGPKGGAHILEPQLWVWCPRQGGGSTLLKCIDCTIASMKELNWNTVKQVLVLATEIKPCKSFLICTNSYV